MAKLIYGIDPSKKVTNIMVRDAIIDCFLRAHKEILDDMRKNGKVESDEEIRKIEKMDVEMLIKRFFEEVGGDFDNPKKEDIIKVCDKLAKFASNFRNPQIIRKHYGEIMRLIERMKK